MENIDLFRKIYDWHLTHLDSWLSIIQEAMKNTPYENSIKSKDQAGTYFNVFAKIALDKNRNYKEDLYDSFEDAGFSGKLSKNTVRLYIGRMIAAGLMIEARNKFGKCIILTDQGQKAFEKVFSEWAHQIVDIGVLIAMPDLPSPDIDNRTSQAAAIARRLAPRDPGSAVKCSDKDLSDVLPKLHQWLSAI